MKEIGKTLKSIREKKGIGRNEMCRRTGFSFQQIQRIEDGNENFTIKTLLKYIENLDVEIHFSGKLNMTEDEWQKDPEAIVRKLLADYVQALFDGNENLEDVSTFSSKIVRILTEKSLL